MPGSVRSASGLVAASAAYACTNYVGYLMVRGDASTATVTATGNQTYGDPSGGMTQTVSNTTAKVDDLDSAGSITVSTASISSAESLGTATYDVNWIQIGYSTHATWLNPSGDCMDWRVPSAATNIGTISISSGAGKKGFTIPDAAVINTGTQESGVCVSDSGSHNGNQAPLLIV